MFPDFVVCVIVLNTAQQKWHREINRNLVVNVQIHDNVIHVDFCSFQQMTCEGRDPEFNSLCTTQLGPILHDILFMQLIYLKTVHS